MSLARSDAGELGPDRRLSWSGGQLVSELRSWPRHMSLTTEHPLIKLLASGVQ